MRAKPVWDLFVEYVYGVPSRGSRPAPLNRIVESVDFHAYPWVFMRTPPLSICTPLSGRGYFPFTDVVADIARDFCMFVMSSTRVESLAPLLYHEKLTMPMAERIAMTVMTTINSTKVNPWRCLRSLCERTREKKVFDTICITDEKIRGDMGNPISSGPL